MPESKFVFVIIGLIAVFGIGGFVLNSTHSESYTACVVSDKDRTTNAEGESDMRVYTENCGVFGVEDSLVIARFNSADAYSQIKVGETYDFKTRGYRIPMLSLFPNIETATPVQ